MTKDTDSGAEQNNRSAPDGFSLDVRLWKVSKAQSKTRPYQLRWKVGGKVSSATFATVALAESRRSELWQAMRRGEAFRIADGLPESEVRAEATAEQVREELPWFAFCREYMAMRWPTAAAKTREGIADGLAAVTLALVEQEQKMPSPEELRLAFRWAVIPRTPNLTRQRNLKTPTGGSPRNRFLSPRWKTRRFSAMFSIGSHSNWMAPPQRGRPPVVVGARSTRRLNTPSSASF
ncbi:hypothetical protein ABZ258_39055 [Streptomyces canus]